jgi:HAD superfamily hydrolase (TIGR01662 family)
MNRLTRPDYLIGSASDLTPEALQRLNPHMRAVIFDFDSTLADYHAHELPDDSRRMMERLGKAGIWNFVASNIYDEPARERQRMLRKLRMDDGTSLVIETVIPATVAGYHGNPQDFKKPAPDMIRYILSSYSLQPKRVCMVGDQMRSDMKSAETLGVLKILTARRGEPDHPLVRFNRPLESYARWSQGYCFFPQDLTSVEDWAALSFSERLAIERQRNQPIDISN